MTVPEERGYPFWTWEDLALFLGMAVPSLLAAAVLVRVAAQLAPRTFSPPAMKVLPFQLLVYVFLFAALWGLLRLRHGRPFWQSLAWNFPLQRAWLSLALGPVLAMVVSGLGVALRAPVVPTPFQDMIGDRASLALVILFAAVLGPLAEELIFRGFLFPLLERALGPWPAIVVAALPFALLHGNQYRWSWQHILLVGLAGVVFGWARYRSGSTASATMIHATYNLTFLAGFLAQRTA